MLCWFCVVCVVFFFSSRRRHTRLVSDWSSDVCSSDLLFSQWLVREVRAGDQVEVLPPTGSFSPDLTQDAQRSEERRVGKSVDLGGRRILKKNRIKYQV